MFINFNNYVKVFFTFVEIMKKIFIFLVLIFYISNNAYAQIECNFDINNYYEAKSGKFKKGKIYDDEKVQKFRIDKITKVSDKSYQGELNGAGHDNRKVKIVDTNRTISISQLDARNPELFAQYTIFKNQKDTQGYMSSMYQVYPSNWGFGAIYLYTGYCNINN